MNPFLGVVFGGAWLRHDGLGTSGRHERGHVSNDIGVRISTDYFGRKRKAKNPTPGPFETPGQGTVTLKVW